MDLDDQVKSVDDCDVQVRSLKKCYMPPQLYLFKAENLTAGGLCGFPESNNCNYNHS